MNVLLPLLASVIFSATSGSVVTQLAEMEPFAIAAGVKAEVTMNRLPTAPRHTASLALVPVGDGAVLALGETGEGVCATVTAVRGGGSEELWRRELPLPADEDLAALPFRIEYDAGKGEVRFSLGKGGSVACPVDHRLVRSRYRLVPSQAPRAILVEGDRLASAVEASWHRVMDDLWDPGTGNVYDYISSNRFGEVSYKACMPTPEEVKADFPNPSAWRTGFEDTDLKGGPMLVAAVRRLEAHGGDDAEARATIDRIYRGLMFNAEVSGIPGFLARGVLPTDGKSFYTDTSRDQYTLFIYSTWRLYRSKYTDGKRRDEIRRKLVEIAAYLRDCLTIPERKYSLLRADGKIGSIGYMWVANPRKVVSIPEDEHFVYFDGLMNSHEAFRAPMFFMAAWDVTGDEQWHEEAKKYYEDAFFMTGEKFVPYGFDLLPFALYQAQVSHRLLYETEPDAEFKARMADVMARFAKMAEKGIAEAEKRRNKISDELLYAPTADWHEAKFYYRSSRPGGQPPGDFFEGKPYMIPLIERYWPAQCIPEHLGLSLLSRLMVPGYEPTAEELATFERVMVSIDWSRHHMSSQTQSILAYWALRWRERKN